MEASLHHCAFTYPSFVFLESPNFISLLPFVLQEEIHAWVFVFELLEALPKGVGLKLGVLPSNVVYHFGTSGLSIAFETGLTHPLGIFLGHVKKRNYLMLYTYRQINCSFKGRLSYI